MPSLPQVKSHCDSHKGHGDDFEHHGDGERHAFLVAYVLRASPDDFSDHSTQGRVSGAP